LQYTVLARSWGLSVEMLDVLERAQGSHSFFFFESMGSNLGTGDAQGWGEAHGWGNRESLTMRLWGRASNLRRARVLLLRTYRSRQGTLSFIFNEGMRLTISTKPAIMGMHRDNYIEIWEAAAGMSVGTFFFFEWALLICHSLPSIISWDWWMGVVWRGLMACSFFFYEARFYLSQDRAP